jgi:inorganic pyrophosphatase
MRGFFADYKKLEKKSVLMEDFLDRETAIQILQDSFKMYQEKFNV